MSFVLDLNHIKPISLNDLGENINQKSPVILENQTIVGSTLDTKTILTNNIGIEEPLANQPAIEKESIEETTKKKNNTKIKDKISVSKNKQKEKEEEKRVLIKKLDLNQN